MKKRIDSDNSKFAYYIFRGIPILKFDKEKKQLEIQKYSHMYCFDQETIKLLSYFVESCHLFSMGIVKEVKNIEINS